MDTVLSLWRANALSCLASPSLFEPDFNIRFLRREEYLDSFPRKDLGIGMIAWGTGSSDVEDLTGDSQLGGKRVSCVANSATGDCTTCCTVSNRFLMCMRCCSPGCNSFVPKTSPDDRGESRIKARSRSRFCMARSASILYPFSRTIPDLKPDETWEGTEPTTTGRAGSVAY